MTDTGNICHQVEEGKLEVKDRELQKQLHLTTADLRFSELLVRQVTEQKSNVYLDGTGEGTHAVFMIKEVFWRFELDDFTTADSLIQVPMDKQCKDIWKEACSLSLK